MQTPNLGKWPGIVVVGDSVTPEQAEEIIVRTSGGDLFTNDKEWQHALEEAIGFPKPSLSIKDFPYEGFTQFYRKYGILTELEYLTNARIASNWIGGMKGWVNWNGRIFCNNYNIGKWPSVSEVFEEWDRIASTFPYLKLKCWLLSDEMHMENARPVVQFNIHKGMVFVPGECEDITNYMPTDDLTDVFVNRLLQGSDSEHIALEHAVRAYNNVAALMEART
jgi:hypothetical protein